MGFYEYRESQDLLKQDYTFYGLIMAAMRRADTYNLAKLQEMWPDTWNELRERYNAPGGLLDGETF